MTQVSICTFTIHSLERPGVMDGGREITWMCVLVWRKQSEGKRTKGGERRAAPLCSRRREDGQLFRREERRQISGAALNVSAWHHLLITGGLMWRGPPPSHRPLSAVNNYPISSGCWGCLVKQIRRLYFKRATGYFKKRVNYLRRPETLFSFVLFNALALSPGFIRGGRRSGFH